MPRYGQVRRLRNKSTSPIQILPPEIFLEVFKHAIWSDISPPRPSIRQAPLNIARVCTYWRRLVKSHGHLWSRLRVGTGLDGSAIPYRNHSTHDAYALRKFMDRSMNSPFDLTLAYTAQLSLVDIRPIFKELFAQMRRVTSLELSITDPQARVYLPLLFASLKQGGWPLRSLNIYVAPPIDTMNPFRPELDLRQAHHLRNLRITYCNAMLRLPEPGVSSHSHRLRHLELRTAARADTLLHWISNLPYLETLSVFAPHAPSSTSSQKEVTMPRLLAMRITGPIHENQSGFGASHFLSHLRAPALQEFHHISDPPPFPHAVPIAGPILHNFVRQCVQSLKALSIDSCTSPSDAVKIMCSLPGLRHLALHRKLACDGVVGTLAGIPGKMLPCPQLLVLRLNMVEHLSSSILTSVIMSRCAKYPVPPLLMEEELNYIRSRKGLPPITHQPKGMAYLQAVYVDYCGVGLRSDIYTVSPRREVDVEIRVNPADPNESRNPRRYIRYGLAAPGLPDEK